VINFHCTVIPVVVLDSVVTHTSAWFLDREIHQLVYDPYSSFLNCQYYYYLSSFLVFHVQLWIYCNVLVQELLF